MTHPAMRLLIIACSLMAVRVQAQSSLILPKIPGVDWDKTVTVSRSTATLQVVTNPMLNAGSPLHDGAFAALKALQAEYVRYVPWLPYPRVAVAELEPPTATGTSWDFTHIDPITQDFLSATEGHSIIMNFSTIPAWMFRTEKPVIYPKDPNQVFWGYTQGTQLRDPSGKELGDYYGRLVSWYTRGGFTDEIGKWHESGHHYSFPYWEVLNEIESEHQTNPQQYTERYDAIVTGIRAVSPSTKFVGLALAEAGRNPDFYEYFLNPKNHRPGIPLDMISFHFYATPAPDEGPNEWQHSFFDQADGFIRVTRFIVAIRNRLSPGTRIDSDELGVILPTDSQEVMAGKALPDHIPARYWNAAASMYAYLYAQLGTTGVDVIGESQLVGYPSQFPSVSMIDYKNGKPNARYWVLKLLLDNFHPGDRLVANRPGDPLERGLPFMQGFATPHDRKVLLVNKTNGPETVSVPGEFDGAAFSVVDEATGDNPPRTGTVTGITLTLAPFAVMVLTLR